MEDELLREVTQRRMVAWLAGLAAVLHMLAFFAPSEYRQGLVRVPAGYGFLATLLVLWLNGKPRWDRVMRGVILSIVAAWLGMDLFQGMRLGRGVSTWMVLDTVLMSVMLFSFLPPRAAILGSVVTYGCFLVMAWLAGGRDVLLLVYVGLLLAFAAYLALHGQLVARERMRADVLRWQVYHDGLTGAVTRQALLEELIPLMGGEHVVLMVDLDHFKTVNDSFGHLVGDEALKHLTRVLKERVRPGDVVCRWGGEEFVVLLRDVTLAQGLELAEGLRRAVVQSPRAELPALTVSVGVASLSGVLEVEALISQVDAGLYAAKAQGRNRVLVS